MSKSLLAELLVDGWTREFNMGWLVNRYSIEVGDEDLDAGQRFTNVTAILGNHVKSDQPIRAFARNHMRRLSDLGWSNAPRDRLILAAKQDLGIRNQAKGRATVGARSNDKRHDWNTVK
jgi:hypothetical protein